MILVLQVYRVNQGLKDRRVSPDLMDHKGHRDHLDLQQRQP